jgi:predicted nuclease with TOPRIM domain
MAELEKAITTQEELDSVIKDRLARQETKIRGEYSDYEDLKKKSETWNKEKTSYEETITKNKTDYEALNKQYQEAAGKIANYEADALKTKVAVESGIPIELRTYLKGSTEDEIKASAAELAKYAKGRQVPPLADPVGDPPKGNNEQYKKLLKNLRGE